MKSEYMKDKCDERQCDIFDRCPEDVETCAECRKMASRTIDDEEDGE